MNKQQIILTLFCAALIALLYNFGQRKMVNTQAPNQGMPNMPTATQPINSQAPVINMTEVIKNLSTKIPSPLQDSISQLQQQVATTNNKAEKATLLVKLSKQWEKAEYLEIAAYYLQQSAKNDSTAKNWTLAANYFSDAFRFASDSVMRQYLLSNAVESYQNALQLDSSQTETKINLAACLFDGYSNQPQYVMQGVTLLRSIVAADSSNFKANLLLGRMAIVSGQFDRAAKRLETALRTDPNNSEALFFLGNAYAALGKKEKAIDCYKKSKNLIKNPTFAHELEQLIKNLQNN